MRRMRERCRRFGAGQWGVAAPWPRGFPAAAAVHPNNLSFPSASCRLLFLLHSLCNLPSARTPSFLLHSLSRRRLPYWPCLFLTCPASSFSHFRSACSILLVTDAPATRSTTLSSRGVHLEQPILIILPSIRPPLSGECLSPPAAHSTLLPLSRLRSHAFFFY